MAIRLSDSFDTYGSTANLIQRWPSAAASWVWVSNGGRFGGGAIRNAGAASGDLLQSKFGIASDSNWWQHSFYFKASGIPATAGNILTTYNSGGGQNGAISITSAGMVAVYNYHGNAAVTGTINVCDGNWHWIEAMWQLGGTIYLYIDNLNQGTGPGGSFGGASYDHVAFTSIGGITVTVDDYVAIDANSPVGPIMARQVTALRPISDAVIGFATTSSGSTHFNLVADWNGSNIVPDGDTSYVQDGTIGNQDLLNFSTLGYTPNNVTGVMLTVYGDNPNGGTINLQGICKSASVQGNATAIATPLIYATQQYAFQNDPNTGVAWTGAAVNSAQWGYKNA